MYIIVYIATFKEAVSVLGGLDILINNAGIINEEDFTKTVEVNVVSINCEKKYCLI